MNEGTDEEPVSVSARQHSNGAENPGNGAAASDDSNEAANAITPLVPKGDIGSDAGLPGNLLQAILNATATVEGFDVQLLPASFRALEAQYKLSPSYLSFLITITAMAMVVGGPIWGAIADRQEPGRTQLLALGCSLWGFVSLAFAGATDYPTMVALRCVGGIALASLNPIAQSAISDLYPSAKRGKAFGGLFFCFCMGSVLGAVIGASFSNARMLGGQIEGWRVAFTLSGLMSLMLGVVIFLVGKDPKRHYMHATTPAWNQVTGTDDVTEPTFRTTVVDPFTAYIKMAYSPSLVIILIEGSCATIAMSAFGFSTLIFQNIGFDDKTSGMITGVLLVGFGVGAFVGGWLGDKASQVDQRRGRPIVGQLSTILVIPVLIFVLWVMPKVTSNLPAYVPLMFIGGFVAGWPPTAVNRPVIADIVVPQQRGAAFAVVVALQSAFGTLIGPPAMGLTAELLFGYKTPGSGGVSADIFASSDASDFMTRKSNAHALSNALLLCTVIPYVVAFCMYVLLTFTYKRDMDRLVSDDYNGNGNSCRLPAT
eukprot:GHVU01051646.1.p1 GENE.GHVU01051646.1~~GHVU01051646.1.p1  ORF type:complete len:540 (+),score=25.13 GHVU01051646.1:138-1757(+)